MTLRAKSEHVCNHKRFTMLLCIPSFPFTEIKNCTTNSGKHTIGLPRFINIKFMGDFLVVFTTLTS